MNYNIILLIGLTLIIGGFLLFLYSEMKERELDRKQAENQRFIDAILRTQQLKNIRKDMMLVKIINISKNSVKKKLFYNKYSNQKYNYQSNSVINRMVKELLNKIVFLVWSDEFDEKEYAYRWCISGRNKGNSY